jgi:hypothetical protein
MLQSHVHQESIMGYWRKIKRGTVRGILLEPPSVAIVAFRDTASGSNAPVMLNPFPFVSVISILPSAAGASILGMAGSETTSTGRNRDLSSSVVRRALTAYFWDGDQSPVLARCLRQPDGRYRSDSRQNAEAGCLTRGNFHLVANCQHGSLWQIVLKNYFWSINC